jgi:hypothetical protein
MRPLNSSGQAPIEFGGCLKDGITAVWQSFNNCLAAEALSPGEKQCRGQQN